MTNFHRLLICFYALASLVACVNKSSNKTQITKMQELAELCKSAHERANEGFAFGGELDERLLLNLHDKIKTIGDVRSAQLISNMESDVRSALRLFIKPSLLPTKFPEIRSVMKQSHRKYWPIQKATNDAYAEASSASYPLDRWEEELKSALLD